MEGRAVAQEQTPEQAVAAAAFGRTTVDMVNHQWGRCFLRNAIPLHVVDNPEFRKAVKMTAQCGPTYVSGGDTRLPHRTAFTANVVKEVTFVLPASPLLSKVARSGGVGGNFRAITPLIYWLPPLVEGPLGSGAGRSHALQFTAG